MRGLARSCAALMIAAAGMLAAGVFAQAPAPELPKGIFPPALPGQAPATGATPAQVRRSPPTLGQHTGQGLGDLLVGFSLRNQGQHFAYFRRVDLAMRLSAAEQQVQQVVVGEVHQGVQTLGLPCCDRLLVVAEKALDDEVVF